ncbi:MAG: helix-turn-helix transcriptional regulator [Eggerthellaceae bacterium]|nr:helix-turn-helix transcriptional regulator [Eggerthellaceae bacterium]
MLGDRTTSESFDFTHICGLVGYVMMYSWTVSFFFYLNPFLFPSGPSDLHETFAMGAIVTCGIILALFFISLFSDWFAVRNHSIVLVIVFSVCVAVAFFVPIQELRALFLGLSYSCLVSLWDNILSRERDLLLFGCAMATGGIIGIAISFFPASIVKIILAFLPVASIILYLITLPNIKMPNESLGRIGSKHIENRPLSSFAQIIRVISVGFMLGFTAYCIADDTPWGILIAGGYTFAPLCIALAGGLMILDCLKSHIYGQSYLSKVALVGMMPCIFAVPFCNWQGKIICGGLILFIMMRHGGFVLDNTIQGMNRQSLSSFFIVAKCRCIQFVGFIVGWLSSFYIMGFINIKNLSILFCFIIIYLWVLQIIFIFQQKEKNVFENYAPKEETKSNYFQQKIDLLATKYGLTSRQKEILAILAKGHGVDFISQELYISKATVKSHTYTIYKKMGVHTREEVMRLVEDLYIDDKEQLIGDIQMFPHSGS